MKENKNVPFPLSENLRDELKKKGKECTCVIVTRYKKDEYKDGKIINHIGEPKFGTGFFLKFNFKDVEYYYLITCSHVLNEDDIKYGEFDIKYGNEDLKQFIIGNRKVVSEKKVEGNKLNPDFTAI